MPPRFPAWAAAKRLPTGVRPVIARAAGTWQSIAPCASANAYSSLLGEIKQAAYPFIALTPWAEGDFSAWRICILYPRPLQGERVGVRGRATQTKRASPK
jgi:hypothetical protein